MLQWLTFLGLGMVWGSSYFWIKTAVEETDPLTVVALRLSFGLLGMLILLKIKKLKLPRDPKLLFQMTCVGLLNAAIPFFLITWGETRVDSALACVLCAAVPLFTTILAHFALKDDQVSVPKIAGVAVGLLGVGVLVSRDLNATALHTGLLGQIAILVATLSYAMANVGARRYNRGQNPIVQATMLMLSSWIAIALATAIRGHWPVLPKLAITWIAVGWLGLLGSCAAFVLYFWLLEFWGPTKTSLVNYISPLVGLTLGTVFRHEIIDWHLGLGSILVISGILVVNVKGLVALGQKSRRKKSLKAH